MKIAIIGGGFCGLSTAYALISQNHIFESITLFDYREIGASASGKASGLLHPFAGKRANFSYEAEKAFPEAIFLIQKMHDYSVLHFNKPVILQKGILRPAVTESQKQDFYIRSQEKYPLSLLFLPPDHSSLLYSNDNELPSLYIPEGIAIDSLQYISTLFHICRAKGLKFYQEKIDLLDSIQGDYDHIIVTAGYETKSLLPNEIYTNNVKGQRITVKLPSGKSTIPKCALSGTAYAVFSTQGTICLGSTYEHHFSDEYPNEEIAKKEIFPKISLFAPEFVTYEIDSIAAGIRATTPNSHPIFLHKPPNIWALTGLGSKGLLYHAYLAQKIGDKLQKK